MVGLSCRVASSVLRDPCFFLSAQPGDRQSHHQEEADVDVGGDKDRYSAQLQARGRSLDGGNSC